MSISYGLNLGIMNGAADGDLYGNAMRAFQRACDAFLQPTVKGYLTNTPPGSPVDGDMYIVGSAPTGSWASYAGYVAKWSSLIAAWEFYLPKDGWQFQANSAREIYRRTGGAWEIFYQEGSWTPYIYGTTVAGTNTYSVQTGRYRRIGSMCFACGYVLMSSKDAAMSGSARMGGLPITVSTDTFSACSTWAHSLATDMPRFSAMFNNNSTNVLMFKQANLSSQENLVKPLARSFFWPHPLPWRLRMKIIKPSVTVLSHTHEPELVIERAGRVCYRSEDNIGPGSADRFIRMLKNKGHLSVLEHASASLLLVTDRAIANELVRHRIGASYSQRSTRYVRATDAEFVKPTRIPEGSAAYHYWMNACIAAESNYQNLLDSGCTPEDARSVLPLCTATEIAVTMTFRAWMHFLDLRLDAKAHPDMRVLSHLIQNELIRICPAVFEE